MLRGNGSKRRAAEVVLLAACLAALGSGPQGEAEAVRALVGRQAWREALERARSALDSFPGHADLRAAYAEALFRAGRLEDAAREAAAALVAEAPPPRALLVLGRVRQAEGRHGEARELLERARVLASEDLEILYWSAGAAPTRADIVQRLEQFVALARARGGDPDRIEAALGKIQLFRAVGERRLWVPATMPERAEIPLFALPDGAGGVAGYTLEVRLPAGKAAHLLLDTGSGGLFLLERIARRRGFQALAEETVFGGPGPARHRSRTGLFEWIGIGPLAFEWPLATTTPREIDATGRFHGLLGLSPFEAYRVHLDLKAGKLRLEREGQALLGGTPYWEISGQLLVQARILPDGATGLFLLDTGTDRTTVALGLLEGRQGIGLGPPVEVRGYGGRWEGARRVTGLRVRLGDFETPGSSLRAVDLSRRSRITGVEIAGLLGLDVLAQRHLVLDPRAHRVWISERWPPDD